MPRSGCACMNTSPIGSPARTARRRRSASAGPPRSGWRTANSAAIQPPTQWPTRSKRGRCVGVEQFEIVEDDVVDGAGVELVGAVAAGMRRRDDAWRAAPAADGTAGDRRRRRARRRSRADRPAAGRRRLRRWRPCARGRRRCGRSLRHLRRARPLPEIRARTARANPARSRGATSVANRRMLLRASASCMLPRWNWISRLPTLECVRMSMIRR